MKKIFPYLGGFLLMALLAYGVFRGTIACLVYLPVMLAKEQQAQSERDQSPVVQQKKQNDFMSSDALFVDPDGYKTENNWLAASISREISQMAFVTIHPDQSLPEIKTRAEVDPAKPSVHVEIHEMNDYNGETIATDLTPVFAWDPQGYAPLARKLLGSTPGLPPVPETEATDVLGHLLNLTGPEIATEDIRLSHDLQQHPASSQDHEAAALLLVALALRENAAGFSDERNLLNRATAHLALAQALRGDQPATWPGLIADAAIRTLVGRERDALACLDALAGRADCPDSARTWIMALRLRVTQDWRLADVTTASPLLLKIAWFRVVTNDLPGMVATHRLDQVVPPPVISPDAPPDQQVPTNPELQLPDWGRAVLAWPFDVSVENGHRFTTDNMTREFNELDQVLKIEGSDPIDQNNLAATFAEGESSTVSRDASGNIEIQVIGAGSFKAATRRHLFATIYPTYKWMGEGLGDKDQAASFLDQMNILFRGVPEYELATYLDASEGIDIPKIVSQWRDQKKLWLITDVPVGISLTQLPGKDLAVDFYSAIPFGTLYHVEQRYPFIQQKLQRNYPSLQFQFQKANQLPPDKRMAAINKATADFQAREDRDSAKFRAENSQLTLTPDPSDLLSDGDGAISPTSPILDYNLRKLKSLEGKLLESRFVGSKDWNPSEYEMLLRKHVTMEPDAYFALADFLRTQGKDDEAAAMDRKGAAEAYDQVGMSDSVLNLVDYDLNHGLKDEALAISQKASDLGSQMGMGTYSYVLDRLGRLDEAESVAKEIQADYGDDSWLLTVHIANPDHFPEEYALAKNNAFPDGLVRVGLAFFSGKPQTGCQIGGLSSRLEEAHLEVGDVIVALDGYKVDSERQYGFVQHLTNDSHMDFIIWREGRYIEVKAYLTARRFFAPINDYTGN